MNTPKYLLEEFELRVFEESYERIEHCLGVLSQEQVWTAPNETTVSVGCLIKHLLGNMQQWVYAGVLNGDFTRDRDAEFVPEFSMSINELQRSMNAVKDKVMSRLITLSEEDLTQRITIQGFDVTGFSAIIHVIEHFSYHTGQITTLTKLHLNRETNYYGDRDLNNN